MSEPLPARTSRLPLALPVLASALILCAPNGTARAEACPQVAEALVLCTADTIWAQERVQRYEEVTAWEADGFFLEFNPAMTDAAGDGPGDAALDRLLAILLQGDDAPAAAPVLRDRFETGAAQVERGIFRIVDEGQPHLGGVMLSDFPDLSGGASPRLVWVLGSFETVPLDDLAALIETTAGGLRPATAY